MQAQPAAPPTKSLQALKRRTHQLVESQRTLQQNRASLQAEYDTLSAQHRELSATREALQAERNNLIPQLQKLTEQRDTLQQERDSLQAERNSLISANHQLSADLETSTKDKQELRKELVAIKTAYLQFFPFEKYRQIREDLFGLSDHELANHYAHYGAKENCYDNLI